MPQVHTQPAVSRLLARIFPSPAAAVVAGLGFGIESALASTATSHAIRAGGAATAVAIATTAWFWLSAVWIAHFAARWVVRRTADRPTAMRWTLRGTVIVAFAGLGIAYIASWGTFLQTRRFLNWEAVRFTLANTRMLWLHLLDADTSQIVWLGIFTMGLLVTVPLVAFWLGRSSWKIVRKEHLAVARMGTWLALAIVVMWLKMAVGGDVSIQRRVSRLDQLANCLNPAVTLAASALESIVEEPIEACLDVAELTPRMAVDSGHWAVGREKGEISPKSATDLPAVIVIAVESLRADVVHLRHQGREVSPNINDLAQNGLQLTRAYAQSTHSDYADVCLASSLYPLRTRRHHFYRADDPWPKTLLYDVLKSRGYATAIISSQNEAWGNMDQFLTTPNLDWFYHPQNGEGPTIVSTRDPGFLREHRAGTLFAGKYSDGHTTDVALDWIEQQEVAGRSFCLFITFQSSHFPYLIPEDCERPFRPYELDADIKFSSYPYEKVQNVRNAYFNAVFESDRQIGRIVSKLREWDRLDETILIVTGENGEAFHENGEVGHASVPVEPAVHIAAVMHAPKWIEPRIDDYPFEHVDLAPTIAGVLGLPPHPNWQGIDALAPGRPPAGERLLFFHVHSPIALADAVLFAGRWKFMTSHKRPGGVLYDLESDPTESYDASGQSPDLASRLSDVLKKWRMRQLSYYHFPMYYQRYYPPKPPRWED